MDKLYWESINTLIVEDSPTQLLLVQENLKSFGTKVQTATNGAEALEQIKRHPPTIIISDIEMPEMNGYELCLKVKGDPKTCHIPVILLTNMSDPLDVIKGIDCGADNFLTKPCSPKLLASSIIDAINNIEVHRNRTPLPPLEFSYRGKRHSISVDQFQITELLLSTYASAIEKNKELEESNRKLSSIHLELQKKNEELSKLVDVKNLLLGMAAHDLRNPLNVIQVYSDLLQMKLPSNTEESALKMLGAIAKSSKFMLQMVNDLLDISVIDLGKIVLNFSKQNFLSLVQDNIQLNQSLAEQKDIKIKFVHDSDIPDVTCDSNKIDQVMNNLISNAIKFSHPGSEIEVSLKKKENEVLLHVKDQGIGIPADEKDSLFDTFRRASNKSTDGEPNIGLGLAIVKKIIDEHRGKIWIESSPKKGSTFYFTLPLQPTPERLSINLEEKRKNSYASY